MSIVKLTNITKRFGSKIVLDNLSLNIEQGDFISVTGSSGKGKTTLLNIIGLIDEPSSGDIEICGYRNPKFFKKEGINLLRNNISYLFQNYGLIEDKDVLYNLRIASRFLKMDKKTERKMFTSVLSEVGLVGYEKRKIYELSGGEQQRVALARILIKPAELILADEPTGSLDPDNRDMVMKVLQKINNDGKTIVVVTHDIEVAQCSKRRITL